MAAPARAGATTSRDLIVKVEQNIVILLKFVFGQALGFVYRTYQSDLIPCIRKVRSHDKQAEK